MTFFCCKCQKSILDDEETRYGLHLNCFKQWFGLDQDSEFSDLIARSQSQLSIFSDPAANISFFNGAYRKYSARLEQTGYILKVEQKEFPELPATEFLSNQIFENLGIEIPEYYLIRYPDHQLCFVTKNFMSGLIASDLVHIYHYEKNGMNHDCESLVKIIGDQTGRRTEQERFVCLTLADSLIGNHDRHGRNLGFIQSTKGMVLAPFYDNPSALALEDLPMLGADLQPRGSIFTKETDKPSMVDYIREWNRLGYGDVVERFRSRLSFETIKVLVQKSYLSEKRQKALLRLIVKRSEELCEV